MIKYLTDAATHLKELKDGVVKNIALWANTGITAETIQRWIDNLTTKETEVEELKTQVSVKLAEARDLQTSAEKYADKIENFALGFHSEDSAKLIEYGIQLRKEAKAKPAVTKKPVITLQDDTDGVGFILSIQADPDADMYEWHKGVAADPSKLDVIPAMTILKTTRKTSFVDDDVQKGQRVFYKVRGINSISEGPWSEPVSKVQ